MKRLLSAAVLIGVGLTAVYALRPLPLTGQEPEPGTKTFRCHLETCDKPAKKPKDDAAVVAELVAILDETKCADTFLATLLALSQFEDKSPLPAVVRNAARLGLLTGLSKESNPTQAQVAIGAYLSGEMGAENRQPVPPAPAGYPQCHTAMPWGGPAPYAASAIYPPPPAPSGVQPYGMPMPNPVPMPLICPAPERIACPPQPVKTPKADREPYCPSDHVICPSQPASAPKTEKSSSWWNPDLSSTSPRTCVPLSDCFQFGFQR